MKQMKVGIVGQGRSGRDIHGVYLKDSEKYRIAAVAELLEERRNRAQTEYGYDVYSDYRNLFERQDLDLIVNATPSHLHTAVSLEFLGKGFNVLCEKPVAVKVEDVDRLESAVERSEKIFAVFQNTRYVPYFKKVKEIVNSGVLGRLVQISIAFSSFGRRWDWQTLQEFNGGSLHNTGPHPVDGALQLWSLGTDIMPEVTCYMDHVNTWGDAEDYVKLILHAKGQPVVDIEISSCCAYSPLVINIHGSCGGLKALREHVEWKYFKPSEAPKQHLIRTPLFTAEGTPSYCTEGLKWYEEAWDLPEEEKKFSWSRTGAKGYYEALYKSLAEGIPAEVTLKQVRQQIRIMEECRRQN